MADPVLIAKAAAAVLTDEKTRKAVGWVLVAVLSPIILLIAFLCALGSGAAGHNATAVELCFSSTAIPAEMPEEYRVCIEDMRASFARLDSAIAAIQENTEGAASLDAIRVKAIFYTLYFGAEIHGDAQSFVDCFVTYEERTRTVTAVDEDGAETETEETYTIAVPIEDLGLVWRNLAAVTGAEPTAEQQANAESIYSLIRYGRTDNSALGGELGEPFTSVDGFCSPLGAGWQSRVTSEFGYRNCPYHGRELHSGLDMAAPAGTSIRAALGGTVVRSTYHNSLGNYTVIDHGGGLTTGYAHQSRRLVSVGDTVEAGEVIGLVGSTGNSTGAHLYLEVRLNGNLQNPRNYLP